MAGRVESVAGQQCSRMVELLSTLATGQGVRPSSLDGVRLMRADRPLPRQPVLYDEPCIVVVARGRKRGYLGGRGYTYDPHSYLLLSAPLPLEVATDPEPDGRSMLGFKVRLDVAVVTDLLMATGRGAGRPPTAEPDAAARAIVSTPIDEAFGDAAVRLLSCLASPADTAVLGRPLMRELIYRTMCGRHGAAVPAVAAMHGRLARVHAAVARMHAEHAASLDVPTLAAGVAMSPSAFHSHFRAVTATSPLRYLKSIRLHRARMLMAHDGLGAAEAAARVGYRSPSQFSREFRRFFGATPHAESDRVRLTLGLDVGDPGQDRWRGA